MLPARSRAGLRRIVRWGRRRLSRPGPVLVGPAHTATYVGNNRVLVGTQVGDWTIAYYVEADDRLLSPWFIVTGQYETALTDFLLRTVRPDSHCLDIGTNFGFYTCLLARHAPRGCVIGVEADAAVAGLARDNLFINALHGQADVIHAAAGAAPGETVLFRRVTRSGNTSVVDVGVAGAALLGEPPPERFAVPTVTIDDLSARMDGRVDLIKIDVEGAEPRVLAGAAATIRANPDLTIAMEWSPGQVAAAATPPDAFARQIVALGLAAATLDGRPLSLEALAALPYQSAVILRPARR